MLKTPVWGGGVVVPFDEFKPPWNIPNYYANPTIHPMCFIVLEVVKIEEERNGKQMATNLSTIISNRCVDRADVD